MAMLPATVEKCKTKPAVRYAGIGEFAAQQGIDRTHVWRVLKGHRQSKRLLAAWKVFKRTT